MASGNNKHGENKEEDRQRQVLEGSVGWNGNPCEIVEEFRLRGQNDGLALTGAEFGTHLGPILSTKKIPPANGSSLMTGKSSLANGCKWALLPVDGP